MNDNFIINRRKFLGFVGCCTCGLLIPACSTVPITERRQLSILPESYINRHAFQLYENVKMKAKLSKDKKTLSQIKEIGFSIIRKNKKIIRNLNMLNIDDIIDIELFKGNFKSEVKEIHD